ncbi:hypothetical protein MLD38_036049 [Melastoma candidum]|uniref:Uncharacterized protein n=1 Tax=Melastoma candidum TaxID=119954 RepID=A0ACB9LJ29_9MYRT|nr:hypothetical protein MLD38_036049 [Melastoma candidum]
MGYKCAVSMAVALPLVNVIEGVSSSYFFFTVLVQLKGHGYNLITLSRSEEASMAFREARVEDSGKLGEELRRADAVVLTYACEQPETLDRLSTFWLPELRRLEIN